MAGSGLNNAGSGSGFFQMLVYGSLFSKIGILLNKSKIRASDNHGAV
jgi:hypothetical protein